MKAAVILSLSVSLSLSIAQAHAAVEDESNRGDPAQRVAEVFERMDENSDRRISFEELQAFVQKGEGDKDETQLRQRFDGLDKNHDGHLDVEEFGTWQSARGDRDRGREMFSRWDADGDGRVTLEEMKLARERSGATQGQERLEQRFRHMDEDQDGSLTVAEVEKAMSRTGRARSSGQRQRDSGQRRRPGEGRAQSDGDGS